MSRKQRRAHLQTNPQAKPCLLVKVRREPAPAAPQLRTQSAMPEPPDLTDADVAFCHRDWRVLLPPKEAISKEDWSNRSPMAEALQSIFFRGGRLEDFGIAPKPGIDMKKVYRFVKCTLGDYGPSHEHKIGGIAHRLSEWCTIKPKQGRK